MRSRGQRSRWTKAGAYKPLRFWEPPKPTWRRSIWQMRWWLAVVACLTALGVLNAYDRSAGPANAVPASAQAAGILERAESKFGLDAPRAGATDPEAAHFDLCSGPIRITCVVDGDTIWYRGEKIRLADINAPEVSEPGCAEEAALGARATDRLLALLNQGPFTLAPNDDGTGRDYDKYGRSLRVVTRDGASLGEQLVDEGLAEEWKGYRGSWC